MELGHKRKITKMLRWVLAIEDLLVGLLFAQVGVIGTFGVHGRGSPLGAVFFVGTALFFVSMVCFDKPPRWHAKFRFIIYAITVVLILCFLFVIAAPYLGWLLVVIVGSLFVYWFYLSLKTESKL